MKKYFVIALLVAAFVIPGVSSAVVSDTGLLPDSSFYFLKSWKESIQLFFTFNAENKAKQYLHLAEVRLAEYQKMLEKGKDDIAEKTLTKYQNQLNRALLKAEEIKQKGKDIKDLSLQIEQSALKHLEVLQENLAKVPEVAKKGIETAIENSQKEIEKFLEMKINKEEENEEEKREELKENNETSDWKTYRNEEYGFEFKYPISAKLSYFPGDNNETVDHIQLKFEKDGTPYNDNIIGVSIFISKKGMFSIDKTWPSNEAIKCKLYQRYTQLINGKNADIIKIGYCPITVSFGQEEPEKMFVVIAISNKEDLIYIVDMDNKFIRDNKLDEKILSTFKFINQ